MRDGRLIEISRLLSLILRHRPHQFGVVLDPEGYAPMEDVLTAVQTRFPKASESELRRVVETIEPEKQRFTICDHDIRANYGHSIDDRVVHARVSPPAILWHGTTERAVTGILQNGLLPMKRQYVHLTTDVGLAARVGARRGRACVLEIDATRAHAQGVAFYRANESFWLADVVPACFIKRQDVPLRQ